VVKKPIIVLDGDSEIKFRAPSTSELGAFRDAILANNEDILEELVQDLCVQPTPEEGYAWINELGDENYFKYTYVIQAVIKEVLKRIQEDHDKLLTHLRDNIDSKTLVGLQCFKGLAKLLRTGEGSPEADAALELIWECLVIFKTVHTTKT